MNPSEFRLKTGLLGFSPQDLEHIFPELGGQAADVLNGNAAVPDHPAQIVDTWWEEVTTAVENTVEDARESWAVAGEPIALVRYGRHHLLPRGHGAQASSIQAWDYHLGLVTRQLEQDGIPFRITTIQD